MGAPTADPFVVKSFLPGPKSFKVAGGYCKTEGKQELAVLQEKPQKLLCRTDLGKKRQNFIIHFKQTKCA